jgi:putative ABC transport system ATP-binding protein
MHHPVGLDRLRLPLGFDEPVPGQPVEDLVQVADVQPAPLIADGLLKAGLQPRRAVGFVFQRYNLLPALTALDNVIAPVLPYRTSRNKRDRGRELLAAVGLDGREQWLPTRMSGGEQQRVAIARALINSPSLLLADEPTGNLDPQNATEVISLIARLRQERQMTILLASHDPQIGAQSERMIRLRDGAVIGDIALCGG